MSKYIIYIPDPENNFDFGTVVPYVEPDLDAIRKEAHDKCMSEAEDLAYKLYSPKIDEAYKKGLSDGKSQDAKDFADMYDSGYSEGLKDAWGVARKIAVMPDGKLEAIFGTAYLTKIFTNYSASEAVEKIRAYEQEKEKKIDPDKNKVEALANDIGIHKLFALVKEIRGE